MTRDRLAHTAIRTRDGVEVRFADVRKEGMLIPQSRTHICPNGSHFSFYDDQEDYMHALIGCLKDVDAGHFVPDRRTGNTFE